MTVPVAEVGKQYMSDPETDDLIRGEELQDGMVVLVADGLFRGSTMGRYEDNRWCRVSKLKFSPQREYGRITSFVGVYADGSLFPRSYSESYFWYVKKDSVPA